MDQQEKSDLNYGENLWKNLQAYKNRREIKCSPEYEKFADLFAKLGESKSPWKKSKDAYELSAYFYQVSDGEVPKSIFKQVLPREKSDEGAILGIKVKRKITRPDHCLRFVIKYAEIIVIIGFLLASHGMAFSLGLIVGANKGGEPVSIGKIKYETDWKAEAIKKFEQTSIVIKNIAIELTKLQNNQTGANQYSQGIMKKIQEIIGKDSDNADEYDVDYEKANSSPGLFGMGKNKIEKAKEKWVDAIYLYQQSNSELEYWAKNGKRQGVIIQGDNTANLLKCEVADSLEITLIERSPICPPGMIQKEKQKALEAFEEGGKTYLSINQLMIDLRNELSFQKKQEEEIFDAIIETIGASEVISYATRKNRTNKKRGKLVIAIYQYQNQKGKLRAIADGIIHVNGDTYEELKKDVRKKLRARPNNRP